MVSCQAIEKAHSTIQQSNNNFYMTTSQVVMLTKGTILDDDIKKAQCIAIHF